MIVSTVGGGSSNASLGVGGGGLGGFTGAVGAGGGGTSAVTGPGTAVPEEVVEAVALAAWWWAARSRLRSFSDGPRWRGRRGGGGGKEGAGTGGREWGAPGWPREQLNSTLASPPLVVNVRVASPPKAQKCKNSLTDAPRNWEFDLDMVVLK